MSALDRQPVIIGAGAAGLMAALSFAQPVVVLCAGSLEASAASAWAQGGIAAAIGPDDSIRSARCRHASPPVPGSVDASHRGADHRRRPGDPRLPAQPRRQFRPWGQRPARPRPGSRASAPPHHPRQGCHGGRNHARAHRRRPRGRAHHHPRTRPRHRIAGGKQPTPRRAGRPAHAAHRFRHHRDRRHRRPLRPYHQPAGRDRQRPRPCRPRRGGSARHGIRAIPPDRACLRPGPDAARQRGRARRGGRTDRPDRPPLS